MRGRAALALAAAAALVAARPPAFRPPAETIPPELAQADTQVVVANCAGCHSLDYLTTQPRGKGAQFWRDSVTKMVNVYGAPIAAADAQAIAAVLGARL